MDRLYKSFQEFYNRVQDWQQLSDEENETPTARRNSFLQKLFPRSRFSSSFQRINILEADLENFEGVSMFSHDASQAPPHQCYCVATAKYSTWR